MAKKLTVIIIYNPTFSLSNVYQIIFQNLYYYSSKTIIIFY